MGIVILSGFPSEATSQLEGIPFSWAMFSSDIARTSEEIPTMVRSKNEAQATTREIEQMRRFMSFCLSFCLGISSNLFSFNKICLLLIIYYACG